MIEKPYGRVTHRPNQRRFIHLLGQTRHNLAELDTRNFGANCLEITPDIRRRIRFRIPDVDVTWPPLKIENNHRFGASPSIFGLPGSGARSGGLLSLELEDIGQAQSSDTRPANS